MVSKKYTILQFILPINLIMCESNESEAEISSIDKIVTTACALCEHCDSVVPLD